jgi:hypothetical protein
MTNRWGRVLENLDTSQRYWEQIPRQSVGRKQSKLVSSPNFLQYSLSQKRDDRSPTQWANKRARSQRFAHQMLEGEALVLGY